MGRSKHTPDPSLVALFSARLMYFGEDAAPTANTVQRLNDTCMGYMANHVTTHEQFMSFDICSPEMASKICHRRYDHATLESTLKILDLFVQEKTLWKLKAALRSKLGDADLADILYDNKSKDLVGLAPDITIDAYIGFLEGRALFVEKKTSMEFFKEMLALFHNFYPLKKKKIRKVS